MELAWLDLVGTAPPSPRLWGFPVRDVAVNVVADKVFLFLDSFMLDKCEEGTSAVIQTYDGVPAGRHNLERGQTTEEQRCRLDFDIDGKPVLGAGLSSENRVEGPSGDHDAVSRVIVEQLRNDDLLVHARGGGQLGYRFAANFELEEVAPSPALNQDSLAY